MTEIEARHWLIPTSQVGALMHVSMLVGLGYSYHTRGTVHHSKAVGFVQKMAELYPIGLSETGRNLAKRRGKANVKLLLYPDQHLAREGKPGHLRWVLLATKGTGLIHEREKMLATDSSPLYWGDRYVLVKRQKIEFNKDERKPDGKRFFTRTKERLTWALQPRLIQQYQASIHAYCSTQTAKRELALFFEKLAKMPMFYGISSDLKALDRFAADTWRKTRKEPYSSHTQDLGFVRKITVWGELNLGHVVDAYVEAERTAQTTATQELTAILDGLDEDPTNALTDTLTRVASPDIAPLAAGTAVPLEP